MQKNEMRNLYAKIALDQIPRLLGLVDKNKFSRTYGCFDRNFWHYKIIDFPSGMFQLGVLPLTLVWKFKFPGNVFWNKSRIKELSLAGIKFLERSSHSDGTCDEFYPFERALGATAFTLYASTESYMILNVVNDDIERFFMRRGDWLLKNDEPNTIANHQAGTALALLNLYEITSKRKYLIGAKERIKRTLELTSNEGWFLEYEGCDPGYLTFTIDFLAKYYKKTKYKKIIPTLKRAVEFSSYFIHPDGSYGGEYGSRNTYHFLPHGFEILGREFPLATQVADKFLEGLKAKKNEFMDDEKYFFYNLINNLQAYLDFNHNRRGKLQRKDFRRYFDGAKLYVAKDKNYYVIISLAKGGVIKVFRKDKNIYNDSGLIGVLDDNNIITSQMIDDHSIKIDKKISVSGKFNSINMELQSIPKLILFRLGLMTLGRNWKFGKLIKKLLVKRLISRKKRQPVHFERSFEIDDGVKIKDKIKLIGNKKFKKLSIGSGHTGIYVPSSEYFQESVLNEWIDLSNYLDKLNEEGEIEITRIIK